MKIGYDKKGRKLYKFSHSVHQGGFVYSHKTRNREEITNKEGLKNALNAIAKHFELIDFTIKVYDGIFFLFYMSKPSLKPIELIERIQKDILSFGNWDSEYICGGVDDLQEFFIKKELKKWGFDYEKG